MPFTYAILGTGALGGYYGGLLQRAGFEVHFLLHSDFEHVRGHGLVIESRNGNFNLPQVNVYGRAQDMPACDVAIVALKSTQNHLLPAVLPPAVKEQGVALTLQNGLGNEEAVAAIVGAERTLGGVCFLCSNKIGPGHIRHLDYGSVAIGQYIPDPTSPPRPASDRLRQIAADFRRAGIETDLADDLLLARWKKLVWNIPYNGLSVILNAGTDQIMANPHTAALAEAIMHEVAAIARCFGREIPPPFIARMLEVTRRMYPYKTSMKLDYDAGRPMELQSIYGIPVSQTKAAGGQPILIESIYQQLKYLEGRSAAQV